MIKTDERLVDTFFPTLRPGSYEVLIAIVRHMDTKTKTCFPSEHRLMKLTNRGRDSIRNAKKDLQKANLLKVWQEKENGKFSKTMYQITTPLISIWVDITVDQIIMQEEEMYLPSPDFQSTVTAPLTEIPSTDSPTTEKRPLTNNSIRTNNSIQQPPTPKGAIDESLLIEKFNSIHKSYFGNKRSKADEFAHFKNICKRDRLNILETIELLAPAIEKQKEWRKLAELYNHTAPYGNKIHIPSPKNLQGWITSHRWTDELLEIPQIPDRTPELDDTVLPSELSEKYTAYRAWVEKTYPKLAKSKCRVLSKSEFFDYKADRDYPRRKILFSDTEYLRLLESVHKDLEEKPWILNDHVTVWEYFKKQRTAKVNAA